MHPHIIRALILMGVLLNTHVTLAVDAARFDISQHGAVGDGNTVNTITIQKTIDTCAAAGGGVIVVPKGEFITGSLFLKPGVHLELLDGAILRGSKNIADYPVIEDARFEGHFQPRVAAIINATKTDGLRITGPGMIDGCGKTFWWTKVENGYPRNCYIRDSRDVVVSGVTFMDSGQWNLHFYNCQDVVVEKSRFEISGGSAPSTDGVDIDSSQNVVVKDCYFKVNDDCVCLKGNRYDGLNQKPESLPVKNVRVFNCTFAGGHGALTLGTEAQLIEDVEFYNSKVIGEIPVLRLKMRPDTSGQHYRNVNVHDIEVDGTGPILSWELRRGTKVQAPPPLGLIEEITVTHITGKYGTLGNIAATDNANVKNITLKDWNVALDKAELTDNRATGVMTENIIINGQPYSP